MVQKWIRAAMCAAFGMVAVVVSFGAAATAAQKDKDKKEELPSISDIMKKAHTKTDGYLDKIAAAAKDGKWDEAQKTAKDLGLLADALGKNKPKMGDEKSWEKLCKKYADNTKAIADAADKKDAKEVNAALGTTRMSCGECHTAHRPMKKKK